MLFIVVNDSTLCKLVAVSTVLHFSFLFKIIFIKDMNCTTEAVSFAKMSVIYLCISKSAESGKVVFQNIISNITPESKNCVHN